MSKFIKITKKEFCDELCGSHSILIFGGFSSKDYINEFADAVIKHCDEVDVDNANQRTCQMRSKDLMFIDMEGWASYYDLYYNDGSRDYWRYGNILIGRTIYNNYDWINYVIYLCV